MAACTLVSTAWFGIYYMPTPTVTLKSINAAINQSNMTNTIANGATSWTVYDGAGNAVGSGTMLSSATSVTPVSAGSFVGGGAVKPGYYTVVTNSGTNQVVVGNFCICPASSNLYVPASSGDAATNFAAWLGTSEDRDNYSYLGGGGYQGGWPSPSQIVTARGADQYFTGPQDAARPRRLWVASHVQASNSPTPAQWAALATALIGAGYTGAWYECPTNEPEFAGLSNAQIITQWNAAAAAILAVDSTANVMGYCSAGVFNTSSLANVASFLAGATSPVAAFSNHMENSHQNTGDIVALRQYFGALKTQFASSGVPNLDLWLTETGINGGVYGVLQPRREARQRTVLRFVAESYGWAKENHYDFPIFDHHGSGLTSYLVDWNTGGDGGNIRAGAFALHVMAEALYGTSCSPSTPPAKLAFGATGSMADSMFAGTHYTAAGGDRVLLATNGIESATVMLAVSCSGTITYWDGWGNPSTVTVSGGRITIPLNDLLTYVFLPASTTVSVVDTDQSTVALSGSSNLLTQSGAVLLDEASASAAGVVNNGSFAENNAGISGIGAPYTDSTVPGSLTGSTSGGASHSFAGYAIKGAGVPWQTIGCGIIACTVTVDGVTVDSYTCASAVSFAIPSASNGNSADPCTRTTWWTGNFARAVSFSPTVGVALKIALTTGYGGQPDAAASNNVTSSNLGVTPFAQNSAQTIELAEAQIYTTVGAGGNVGRILMRLATG